MSRVDVNCSLISTLANLLEIIPTPANIDDGYRESLRPRDIESLKESFSFNLPFVTYFATEVSTCFHDKVFVTAVAGKLLQLSIRILVRFECLIGQMLRINTPSFTLDQLLSLMENKTDAVRPRISAKELIMLVDDTGSLAQCLVGPFCNEGEARMLDLLHSKSCPSSQSPIRRCLTLQSDKLNSLRERVWVETCRLLSLECKDNLLGIKGVASKYRMTNKPPPNAPSPYVETIFKPIRYITSLIAESLIRFFNLEILIRSLHP